MFRDALELYDWNDKRKSLKYHEKKRKKSYEARWKRKYEVVLPCNEYFFT